MWNRMFKPMDIMQRSLSATWMRNAVIRNNIANVETPNFKTSNVEFESIFAQAVRQGGFTATRTNAGHRHFGTGNIDSIQPRIYQEQGLSMRMDGNNVDIESENVKLAQNSLQYNTIMEKLNSEIRRLRMAITES
ncbi:MAG: flagellar basal body rod protein FlgB [Oscillospiraceae bacterium]|nr:flagellar basal body rod protein FlgB [Oscillospiraceae bacterium]